MMPSLADSIADITGPWMTAVLREAGILDGNSEVIHVESKPFGVGQVGTILRSSLTYRGAAPDAPCTVVIKLPSQDEGSREFGITYGMYDREVRFYQELAPLVDVNVPEVIWCGYEPGAGRMTLVFEDLDSSWKVGDAVTGGSVEQVAAALDQLVRLHAPFWNKPAPDKVWLGYDEWLPAASKAAAPAVNEFKLRFSERIDPRLMALGERLVPHIERYATEIVGAAPRALVHSDFRLDNLFFSTGPGPLKAKVIDWQSVWIGPPFVDVCYHIAMTLSFEDRRAHQWELLRRYHQGLVAAGVRELTFEDCRELYRRFSLHNFLFCMSTAITLERSERGDAMFARMFSNQADLVDELNAAALFD